MQGFKELQTTRKHYYIYIFDKEQTNQNIITLYSLSLDRCNLTIQE